MPVSSNWANCSGATGRLKWYPWPRHIRELEEIPVLSAFRRPQQRLAALGHANYRRDDGSLIGSEVIRRTKDWSIFRASIENFRR
jgi:hypothetical protein